MKSQYDVSQQQYHDKSQQYLNSQAHAQGIEFAKMVEVVKNIPEAHVLDLGCGGGHVTYAIAPFCQSICAYDLSPEMLSTVQQQAQQRGLENVSTQQGAAEYLDFPEHHFDVVISRYSAHHWDNIPQAMLHIHRVLKPNGIFILVDILGSETAILDTFLQSIEIIRDPSHVRNYSLSEWSRYFEHANFNILNIDKQRLALNFDAWITRMQTQKTQVDTIRFLQDMTSDKVKSHYQIEEDGSFCSDVVYLVAKK